MKSWPAPTCGRLVSQAKGQMTSAPDKGVDLIIAAGAEEGMVAEKVVGLAGCLVNIWCESRSLARPVSHSSYFCLSREPPRTSHSWRLFELTLFGLFILYQGADHHFFPCGGEQMTKAP